MSIRVRGLRAALLVVCVATACAGGPGMMASKAVPAVAMQPAEAPPPLDRSLFARNPDGTLSEEQLQKIIDSPIELDLPARVGVLPIIPSKDWRGPGPSYEIPSGVHQFVKTLKGSEHFTLVTEIMPIQSGALGMEALREMAARYRLRYIILYRETYQRRERANGWAVGYATLVGSLFLPGATLMVDGYLEASMFDVKTGLLMFTVRRSVTARRESNVWHQDDKMEAMQIALSGKFAPDLAKDVWNAVTEFSVAIDVEDEQRAAKAQRQQAQPPAAPIQPQDAASDAPPPTAVQQATNGAI
jgi:hypothetical protein